MASTTRIFDKVSIKFHWHSENEKRNKRISFGRKKCNALFVCKREKTCKLLHATHIISTLQHKKFARKNKKKFIPTHIFYAKIAISSALNAFYAFCAPFIYITILHVLCALEYSAVIQKNIQSAHIGLLLYFEDLLCFISLLVFSFMPICWQIVI